MLMLSSFHIDHETLLAIPTWFNEKRRFQGAQINFHLYAATKLGIRHALPVHGALPDGWAHHSVGNAGRPS